MELIRGIQNLRQKHRGCVLTIGKFDGVHLGHQAVLSQVVEKAKELGLPATVMVFEPQPEELFTPEKAPARLSLLRDKYIQLKALGIDRLLCVKFDRQFADFSATDFVEGLLVEKLGIQYLVIGDDFRFGKGRVGDFATLQDEGEKCQFEVVSTQSLRLEACRVSSTAVRDALSCDDFVLAKQMLGRPFTIGLYPKGGWARAYSYIKHRLRRLPVTPEEIARGVAIGVFTSFTPFYGLHFFVAWVLALVLRANVLASLLGTFFGNPLTYIPIGATALGFGHAFLGKRPESDLHLGLGEMFARAVTELAANIAAFFSQTPGDWTYLIEFWHTVFFPWMIGGVVPGFISGLVIYAITVPAIRVYKNRRKGQLAAKFAEIRRKTLLKREDDSGA